MSADHSLALDALPHMETVTVPIHLHLPNTTDPIHECSQPGPKILCAPEINLLNILQAPLYINLLLNLHKADLIKAAGTTCTECQAPSTKVLYVLSYIDSVVQVFVLSVCNGVPCMDKYQHLKPKPLFADSSSVPIIAVYPFEVENGVAECVGCRAQTRLVKQRCFTMPDPRQHIKIFAYAVCEREKCRSKAEGLKGKDSTMYGPFRDSGNESYAECGEEGARSMCGRCKKVKYCGKECQERHWKTHKVGCQAS